MVAHDVLDGGNGNDQIEGNGGTDCCMNGPTFYACEQIDPPGGC